MAHHPSFSDWMRVEELITDIDMFNAILKNYRNRDQITVGESAQLVKIQIKKMMRIEELKFIVRNFPHVPQYVLERIHQV
uniref:AsIV-cont00029-ORF1 n=1 Tax=Apophua simplicipes ichnovirus TaxID=1329648 RepID=S5DMH4_9VIRU|nr:AsIV-cont00029-ORF1 [Apophua simplicipes ichnovirus]